jgi:hypothetical protein
MVVFIAIATALCDIYIVGCAETIRISISASIGQNESEFQIDYAVCMSAQKPTGHKEKKKERHRLHGSHCSLE